MKELGVMFGKSRSSIFQNFKIINRVWNKWKCVANFRNRSNKCGISTRVINIARFCFRTHFCSLVQISEILCHLLLLSFKKGTVWNIICQNWSPFDLHFSNKSSKNIFVSYQYRFKRMSIKMSKPDLVL